jgi:hypothetical protein
MSTKNELRIALTTEAMKNVINKGIYDTLTQFSVSDKGQLYDVNAQADLVPTMAGGTNQITIMSPSCGNANDKSLEKDIQSAEVLKAEASKIKWEIGRTECVNPFTSANANVTINLKTYCNYLRTTLGTENFNYETTQKLTLIDSVIATIQTFQPADYSYAETQRYENIDFRYKFDSTTSASKFSEGITYLMTVNDGVKSLKTTTENKRWSPLMVYAKTEDKKVGSGNVWECGLQPISWGYCLIARGSKDNTFRKSNFFLSSVLDGLTQDQISEKYQRMVPAVILSHNNSSDSLYTFTDESGQYAGGEIHSTYAYRFFNHNGESLLEGMINELETFIQATYTETGDATGVYESVMSFNIDNTKINNVDYGKQQVDGGRINLTFTWDESGTDNLHSQIITNE